MDRGTIFAPAQGQYSESLGKNPALFSKVLDKLSPEYRSFILNNYRIISHPALWRVSPILTNRAKRKEDAVAHPLLNCITDIAARFYSCDNNSVQGEQSVKTGSNFLEPERIVAGLGLKKGDHVADFGAGHGYFTIPLARAVGRDGKVYAIDIQSATLDMIRSKAAFEHLLNIECVWADLDEQGGSHLKDRFIDFVVVASVLFQAEHKDVLLHEAWRILREGGRLAMIEWDAASLTSSPFGPPQSMRIKKESARALTIQAGFEYDREFSAGAHHYGLLFIKR